MSEWSYLGRALLDGLVCEEAALVAILNELDRAQHSFAAYVASMGGAAQRRFHSLVQIGAGSARPLGRIMSAEGTNALNSLAIVAKTPLTVGALPLRGNLIAKGRQISLIDVKAERLRSSVTRERLRRARVGLIG